jgi:hypothetical protein
LEAAAETAKELTLLDEANAIRQAQANMDVKEIRLARAAAEEERMRKDAGMFTICNLIDGKLFFLLSIYLFFPSFYLSFFLSIFSSIYQYLI